MGGFGSGQGQQGKRTTSDLRALDIRQLKHDGLLTPGKSWTTQWKRNGEVIASIQMRAEVGQVILNYQSRGNSGEWQPMEYPVTLEWTPCNLGGMRVWFLCPAQGCGQRVALLYGGTIFACRHCHKLAYQCQRESDDDRVMRLADAIRQRLGWRPGVVNSEGGKPKGMHWRTFERMKSEYDAVADASLAVISKRLQLMKQQLGKLGLDPLNELGWDGCQN